METRLGLLRRWHNAVAEVWTQTLWAPRFRRDKELLEWVKGRTTAGLEHVPSEERLKEQGLSS